LLLYAALRLLDGSMAPNWSFVYDFVLHTLLIHNLDPATVFGFCGVFWTLALEEHLYLAYFLLVGLRRRWGWATTLTLCLAARAVGLAIHWVLKNSFGWESAFPALFVAQWFVWALGALSVEAYFEIVTLPWWCRDRGVAAGLLSLTALLITLERGGHLPVTMGRMWWTVRDPVLGFGFFVLVNSLLLGQQSGPHGGAFLQKVFATLGVFSYSLYLVHQAIQLHIVPMALTAMDLARNVWMAPFVVGLCILFARLFFHLFERPFLGSSLKARN
jgi:peptidoglycan/LPS O-acetylase OafA/YrhL